MRRYRSARTVLGTLRRRLLVNAVVDPDEAAGRLPPGLRPHVVGTGTVVGCCLLDIEHLRPARVPAALGITTRAAAHRISAEWESDDGEHVVGVYVPERRTDSGLAVALGGRWFPGVHRPADVILRATAAGFEWSVQGGDFAVSTTVRIPEHSTSDLTCDSVAGTCIGANVGLSPNHVGALEGARMEPTRRAARAVEIDALESTFIAGFATAVPARAYLMEDVAVVWSRTAAPRVANRVAT
jgi:hypothetical protein